MQIINRVISLSNPKDRSWFQNGVMIEYDGKRFVIVSGSLSYESGFLNGGRP